MTGIISNQKIENKKLEFAKNKIIELQNELQDYISKGSGPFLASIYDENGVLIAKEANSVVNECCSNNHAEINTIKQAQKKLKTYDLSKHNLSLYVTSEPCMMCIGAIMWSGIKEVYYGVTSERVEKITGFDEGFKPNWFEEFQKRGILVCGNIESEIGENVLKDYVSQNNEIYMPQR